MATRRSRTARRSATWRASPTLPASRAGCRRSTLGWASAGRSSSVSPRISEGPGGGDDASTKLEAAAPSGATLRRRRAPRRRHDEGRDLLRWTGHAPPGVLEAIPKPMVPVGYRPILWHVMRYYAHFGHKDFILCLGYKADTIKQYFLNYDETISNDFVLTEGGKKVELLASDIQDWKITFVDTGPQLQHRTATQGGAAVPRGRGDVPRQLQRRPDRPPAARTRSSSAGSRPRPPASSAWPHQQLPPRADGGRGPVRASATSRTSGCE